MIVAKKIKIKRGKEEIELTLDEEKSTRGKKVYRGKDSKGKDIKHIEIDMMVRDKDAK